MYAELEIALSRRDTTYYNLTTRFNHAKSNADIRRSGDPIRFDWQELSLLSDTTEYGQKLSSVLWGQGKAGRILAEAQAAAQSAGTPLRLRLFIAPDASELHRLRWETLCNPTTGSPLITNENIVFSRYLSSQDWRPVEVRSQSELRALVAVANPTDLTRYGLAEVDVAAEKARAATALGDIERVELPTLLATEPAAGKPTSLTNLIACLRDGVDILYLVAHGQLKDGESWLWLEDYDSGTTSRVSGTELADQLRDLAERPQLVVLASCQSAGDGSSQSSEGAAAQDGGSLAALGPQLAQAGVPAVVAMQGNVTMPTMAEFMPRFFHELRQDGQIDRAMAAARGDVRSRSDWWMPVLFMQLRSGQLFTQLPAELSHEMPTEPFEPETIPIRGGAFLMGSDTDAPDEAPEHEVTLPDFRIGKFPVTNAQYAEFIRQNPEYPKPTKPRWFMNDPPQGKEDHPVTGVSWRDAVAYCNWLSQADVTGRQYSLPSEAEWERAARGLFARNGEPRRYPWGSGWFDGAATVDADGTTPLPEHTTGASPDGCLDMLGNVQEWTRTIWGSDRRNATFTYPYNTNDGREELDADRYSGDLYRVYRGGSYRSDAEDVRCSDRGISKPDSSVRWRGFRVMMRTSERE